MDVSELRKIKLPLVLFKFGDYDHLKVLREQGTLYCNSIHYFKHVEDNNLRGDPDEHVYKYTQSQPGSLITLVPIEGPYKDKEITFKLNKGVLKQHVDSPWGNLFCLYSINLSEKPIGYRFSLHPRCKEFGSHFLFILDTEEFLLRLNSAMSTLGLKGGHKLVEYIDTTKYSGERSIFQKDQSYQFQNEFRVFLEHTAIEPLSFNIGSLEDISTIYPIEFINHFSMKLGNQ